MPDLSDVYVITIATGSSPVRGVFRDALDAIRAVHDEYGAPTSATHLGDQDVPQGVVYRQNAEEGAVEVRRHVLE